MISSVALFGVFLATVGEHLGHSALRGWSYGVGGAQGALAVCITLFTFVLGDSTPGPLLRSLLILSMLLQAATYGALIYMVYQTRRVMPAE